MQRLNNHPTVKRYHERKSSSTLQATELKLNAGQLREMCLELVHCQLNNDMIC